MISERGVEGLRLREVTDAADVGFGSFYNYFESKEELVEAVVLDVMSSLARTLIAHVDTFDDPAEAAAAAHRWFVRTAVEDPETARLLVNLDQADVQFQQRIDRRLGPEAESQTAEVLLRALGVDADAARKIAHRPLPSVALVDSSERPLSN
jgi:AcrR family transcriptional regulator